MSLEVRVTTVALFVIKDRNKVRRQGDAMPEAERRSICNLPPSF